MKNYISIARLKTYKDILKLKTDEEVLRAYYWNKALCGALYPAMQTLEVTLRNAINEAVKNNQLSSYHGDDWWFEHLCKDVQDKKVQKMSAKNKQHWLKSNGVRKKKSYFEQQIFKVTQDLKKEGRMPLRHDDVLSRLMFGFWVGLLGDDFENVTNKNLLWPNLLADVFPTLQVNLKE